MNLSQTKKFLEALKTAGIKTYRFSTDLGTHYYNNEHSVIALDEANEMIYNLRTNNNIATPSFKGKIELFASDLADIHECGFAGGYDVVKKFIEAYGLPLDDDQLKVLIKIDTDNYDLKPATGDYVNGGFKELSEEELAKLTEEEKAEYNKLLKEHELQKLGLGNRKAASITI